MYLLESSYEQKASEATMTQYNDHEAQLNCDITHNNTQRVGVQ